MKKSAKKSAKSAKTTNTKNCKDGLCGMDSKHLDHSNLLPNLNRVAGQVEGIKKMISEKRYCMDILQQLKSIKSAIRAVEAKILEAHMDSCVSSSFDAQNKNEKIEKIEELKALFRRING